LRLAISHPLRLTGRYPFNKRVELGGGWMDMYIQAAGTWQAVWIISLSRIQLYNELNLFCAALRACNTQQGQMGPMDDVHHA